MYANKVEVKKAQREFLKAYEEIGSVALAAKSIAMNPSRHSGWYKTMPAYARRFRQVQKIVADNLEAEARRRAVIGTTDIKLFKGRVPFMWVSVATGEPVDIDDKEGKSKPELYRKVPVVTRTYSDKLLAMLLRAANPEKYAFRKQNEAAPAANFETREEVLKKAQELLAKRRAQMEVPSEN